MKNYITKIFLGLSLISALAYGQETASNETYETVEVKNFSLKSTDGKTVSLSDYQGKFVVIHIATTWCPYCNAEAPYLEEIYKEYHDKNVEVLIIDVKETKALVQERIKNRFQLSFPVLLDTEGLVAASFAPADVLPELARDEIMLASNMLIDPEGKIQFMSLLDTKNFDVKLVELKKKLDELL